MAGAVDAAFLASPSACFWLSSAFTLSTRTFILFRKLWEGKVSAVECKLWSGGRENL